MKKISISLLTVTLLIFSFTARGVTHTITVQNFFFSPSTLTVNVGDTIVWNWMNGTHTTTSTSVPNGAATWDHNINSASTSFMYKVTAEGTYNYDCSIHPSTMIANFVATFATGSSSIIGFSKLALSAAIAGTQLQINYTLPKPSASQIILFDLAGNEVKDFASAFQSAGDYSATYNVGNLTKGMYFLELRSGDMMVIRKIAVE